METTMKMHINRRNFLIGSLSTTAIAIAPINVKADSGAEQIYKQKYIQCGKINSTNLRYFYYKKDNTQNS
jgi:hypothetical protein